MPYFNQDYIDFFKELEQNNHKEWFHAQKKRYESSVKKPFTHFVGDLIQAIQQHDPLLQVEAKDCISRINRDIRFSKDKTPYNLHFTAFVSYAGRKDKSIPGLFLRFSPTSVGVMGGCFGPSKEQLHKIRAAIAEKGAEFRAILTSPDLVETFGKIQGDTNKRIPKEWQIAYEKESLIANKQFYVVAEREADLILSKDLLDEFMRFWTIVRPLNQFLTKAIS